MSWCGEYSLDDTIPIWSVIMPYSKNMRMVTLICLFSLLALAGCNEPKVNILAEAGKGNLTAIREYLRQGGDINHAHSGRTTLLYCATAGSQKEIVKYLLDNGADINKGNLKNGETPLSLSIARFCTLHSESSRDVVKILLAKGARVQMQDAIGLDDMVALRKIIKTGAKINAKDKGGWTAMYSAAHYGNVKAGHILLTHGALINDADSLGSTPLHYAALKGRTAFIKLAIDHGAKINARDREGDTPLTYAVQMKNSKTVALLRKYGATE